MSETVDGIPCYTCPEVKPCDNVEILEGPDGEKIERRLCDACAEELAVRVNVVIEAMRARKHRYRRPHYFLGGAVSA